MRLGRLVVSIRPRNTGEKALLCRLFGHKMRFAGMGGEGEVYECAREKEPMPFWSWANEDRALIDHRIQELTREAKP